jgi:hypothetical protein
MKFERWSVRDEACRGSSGMEKMRRGCNCAQSVKTAGAPLIGHDPGLTCDPGSAPNRSRLACAPRTSPLNTNCVKESRIVMQIRLHS